MAKTSHQDCLQEYEALALMDIPKSFSGSLSWRRSNNKNFLTTEFVPIDARDDFGGTLAGAVVQIEYKRPKRIKDSEKLLMTLHQLDKGIKRRAYQLEAADESRISSRSPDGNIYGCHEHIGQAVYKVAPLYPIAELSSWFPVFCGKVNLDFTGKLPEYSI